jgi:hypothetical protein
VVHCLLFFIIFWLFSLFPNYSNFHNFTAFAKSENRQKAQKDLVNEYFGGDSLWQYMLPSAKMGALAMGKNREYSVDRIWKSGLS